MSSELRTKIMALIECCDTELVSSVTSTADHILALLTPPATAKLPEGVEVVRDMIDTFTERWYVKSGLYRLDQDDGLVWSKAAYNMFRTYDDALTAALAAPPVPGESRPKTPAEVLKENLVWGTIDGHVFACAHSEDSVAILNAVDAQRARIAELEAENARLRAQYDMVEQERTRLMLGQQVPYTPAEKPDARNFVATGEQRQDDYYEKPITEMKPDPLARAVTVGEMLRLAEHYDRCDHGDHALMVRAIFTPPQGAEHGPSVD